MSESIETITTEHTPILNRLRARVKSDVVLPCNKGKNSTSITNKVDPPTGKMDMQEVLKHLEKLQANTEKNLAESIEQAIEKSKQEINGNIESLSMSVQNIRTDLSGFEEKYNAKFESIETKIGEAENKSEFACNEIKRIEQLIRTGKNTSNDKLKYLEEDTSALKKSMNRELAGFRTELSRSIQEHQAALDQQTRELLLWKEQVEQSVDDVKVRSYGNTNQLRQLTTPTDSIDNKVRANNVIIEGHPEKYNDDGSIVDDAVNDIASMIRKSITDFKDARIKTLIRLGQPKKKGNKRPRPLLVGFDDQATREGVLRKASDIKDKSDNKYLKLSRDQNESAKRKHALVKSCYKLMIKNDFPCSMRGSIITYDRKQYGYDNLSLLPEGCTPHDVKSCVTDDGYGFCYSSEHVYCSNFFPCKVKYEGTVYTSAEHAFQTHKVETAGYTELAAEMLSMSDPYKIKNIGDGIKVKKEWTESEGEVLDEILEAKFDQNPKLRIKLLQDGYASYHEMTTDRKWGTGKRVPYDVASLDRETLDGGNKGGVAITRLKNRYCRALGIQMPVIPKAADSPSEQDHISDVPGEEYTPVVGSQEEVQE